MPRQRDYEREYEMSKARGDYLKYKTVTTKLPLELYEDFKTLVELNGDKMGTLLRQWVEDYTYKK